jgi:translation initiation factor IF-3
MGQSVLRKVMEALKDWAIVETSPKMDGKQIFVLLAPDPVKIKEVLKKKGSDKQENESEKLEDSETDS